MANSNDDDLDSWIETLQGKADAHDPLAAALRDAIKAELSDEEARIRPETEMAKQRLIKRLRSEGLLEKRSPSRRSWMALGLGSAAAVMLALPIALQFQRSYYPEEPDTTIRGTIGTIKIPTADSSATAGELESALIEMGLQPWRVSSGSEVEIQVDVQKSDLPLFSPWFASKGGRAVAPGTYSIVIIQSEAAP